LIIVTLPVHNEADRLESNVKRLDSFMRSKDLKGLIILAEDGSSDKSYEIAKRLSRCLDNIKVFHNDCKLGRGKAIREAWRAVQGDIYVFMDADLATDLSYLPAMIHLVEDEGYGFVTGSRYAPAAKVERPLLRKAFSKFYNILVQALFATGVTDHQCGFKALNKEAVRAVLQLTKEDSWAWDTEVAVVLKKLNFRIAEIPVSWNEMKYKRTPIMRLFNDMYLHGRALVNIYIRAQNFDKSLKLG